MSDIGEEYGTALFSLAIEDGCAEAVKDSLAVIEGIFKSEAEYSELLSSPELPIAKRCELIDDAFGGRVHEYAVSFVKLLCEAGRIGEADECISQYMKLYDASCSIVTADVVSAVALTDDQRAALINKLEAKLSRRVLLRESVDETLLGGMIVKADGSIMDGSLKRSLADLKSVIETT